MRLVIWNCHQALQRKHKALLTLAPDVALIPECADPNGLKLKMELSKSTLSDCVWTGVNANKGLGLFPYNDFSIRKESVCADGGRLSIKADIVNPKYEIKFLGLWTQGPGYIEEAHRSVELHLDELRDSDLILAGDLNSNKIWDNKRTLNHTSLVAKLKNELCLTSAYHNHFNEEQGRESRGTFFFQYKADRSYHIDYIFIPEKWTSKIKSLEVGSFKDWGHLSDHCPMVLDLDL